MSCPRDDSTENDSDPSATANPTHADRASGAPSGFDGFGDVSAMIGPPPGDAPDPSSAVERPESSSADAWDESHSVDAWDEAPSAAATEGTSSASAADGTLLDEEDTGDEDGPLAPLAASGPAAAAASRSAARATDRRTRRRRKSIVWIAVGAVAALLIAAGCGYVALFGLPGGLAAASEAPTATALGTPTGTPAPTSTPTPTETPTPTATSTLPAGVTDITDPDSVTVLVNKLTPLQPQDYAPSDLVRLADIGLLSSNDHSLRAPAADALKVLFAAAAAEGITLDGQSGYRSYETQTSLYNGYVADMGQAAADATSARPGYSEHQTGLAIDISSPDEPCALEGCFSGTRAGQWLAAHAWEYGFILRFGDGQTGVTGYEFEPWHFRYVGVEVSTAMHDGGFVTYEEYLGAPAAPDYAS